jgi:hypothetical protein
VKQLTGRQVEKIAAEAHLHPALPCKELAKSLANPQDIVSVAAPSYLSLTKLHAVRLALVCAFFAGACGDHGSSTPAPTTPTPPPLRNIALGGNVYNTALVALAGAKVEVIDGSQAGLSALTNDAGRFEFSAPFAGSSVTLRATKEGYVVGTQVVSSQANRPGAPPSDVTGVFNFTSIFLETIDPPVNVAGDYSVTFIADSGCDLPNDLRTRTYAAAVTATPPTPTSPVNTRFNVAVSGARFLAGYDTFTIYVAGNYVRFDVNARDAGLVEQIAPSTYLALYGDASASVGTATVSSIATSLRGRFLVCESEMGSDFNCPPQAQRPLCSSTNHRLILTRR